MRNPSNDGSSFPDATGTIAAMDQALPADRIREAAESRQTRLVELTRALVAHRSENPKLLAGEEAQDVAAAAERTCQDLLERELAALGMEIDRFDALPGRPDLVGTLRGVGGGRSLILNGHIDVVPAGDHGAWPHPPFGGELEGGRLWGRGTCDMKGGIACGVVALELLADLGVELKGDLIFQAVVDEETGGPGTRAALARGHVADAAIVLEPTAGEIVTVEGGLEWLRIVVRGQTGHSAARYRSIHAGGQGSAVSAIEKALKLLAAIGELERHWGNTKVHPLMPRGITTINPGVIAGGSGGGRDGMPNGMLAYSNFSDYCALGLSLKYLPNERGEEVKAEFEQFVARFAETDPWLREHPPEIEWGVAGVSFRPSEVASDHPLVETCAGAFRQLVGEPRLGGFEAVSDLAWLAEAGVPAVLYGPGNVAQAHSSAEYVDVSELVDVCGVVALAVAAWCGSR